MKMTPVNASHAAKSRGNAMRSDAMFSLTMTLYVAVCGDNACCSHCSLSHCNVACNCRHRLLKRTAYAHLINDCGAEVALLHLQKDSDTRVSHEVRPSPRSPAACCRLPTCSPRDSSRDAPCLPRSQAREMYSELTSTLDARSRSQGTMLSTGPGVTQAGGVPTFRRSSTRAAQAPARSTQTRRDSRQVVEASARSRSATPGQGPRSRN